MALSGTRDSSTGCSSSCSACSRRTSIAGADRFAPPTLATYSRRHPGSEPIATSPGRQEDSSAFSVVVLSVAIVIGVVCHHRDLSRAGEAEGYSDIEASGRERSVACSARHAPTRRYPSKVPPRRYAPLAPDYFGAPAMARNH